MTADDARLKALFSGDEPSARDPAFSAAVLEAVIRRKFASDMGLIAGGSALLAAALWFAWPVVQPMLAPLGEIALPVAAGLTLAGLLMLAAERAPAALRI
jgi:hypothetical protein